MPVGILILRCPYVEPVVVGHGLVPRGVVAYLNVEEAVDVVVVGEGLSFVNDVCLSLSLFNSGGKEEP